ncbi:tetratricopeptide repeat protein [Pseudomonas sp. dw_358]|uniref:tetratricopeptide repeat protein n=1 Tax=Pseudomonas sp. dw_358 TaxID=2720083 RepID=UPI001BD28ABA|nr:tetratricopeptide repeat protein [Pseudomonas sp. dw_358]
MPKRFRYAAMALLVVVALSLAWHLGKPLPVPQSTLVKHSYNTALTAAHDGKPGAARLLYQQLARTDLSAVRQASLLAELANYPSPKALKLAKAALAGNEPLVRHAAIDCIVQLVSQAQRSLLLGPLLSDNDLEIRFHAARALLNLYPDDLGLYFAELEKVLDQYVTALQAKPDDADSQLELAQVQMHNEAWSAADTALQRARTLQPENLDLVPIQVRLLESQHQPDRARQVLGDQLLRHPDSAFLQSQLGQWLLRNGAPEYALLALTRAVELEPDNQDYRYDLAVALHGLDQVEAAQRQLDEMLRRQPANHKARLLLISYWKETGQLQNVQILLAELEQQNPDDPALQLAQ